VASGVNRKKKQRIDYPNIPSAIRPVPHGDLPVPEPPKEFNLNSEMEEEDTEKTISRRRTYRSRLPRSSIWVTSQTYTK
jgi:hypothetical protein